ncbi:MAG: hypothetical protein JXA78_18850, partial [Anaerolineales bacterium]|nr:hypothetical protein [Anaerolineales bacterium]
SIYGMVFEDLNGSGERELGEPGIAGVTLTLDGTKTTTTDEYGNYTFSTKQAGMHTVVETDPAGYFSTTPNEVHVTVALKSSKQVDFGDAPTSSNFAVIFGTVFEDSDEDTEWDAQEPGISGVTITLDGGATTTTNLYGGYTFSTTLTGAHTVVETDPDGYVSTTQNEVTVYDVAWGNGYEVNFGDTIECDCTKDAYEEDDIAAEAKEIQVGTAYSQTRNFCDDPTDWITFTVQANNVYTITTSSWGQRADTFLALFDTDGQTMLMANDDYEGATDFSARIIWRAALDGVYYIRVSNQAGLTRCNTDYDIWVDGVVSPFRYIYLPLVMKEVGSTTSAPEIFERSPAEVLAPLGVINHICPDVYEVDDTWEQAAAISPGVLQVHSFDSNPYLYAADKDLVWVEMMAGDTVTFTVGPVTGTLPLMELFDETGVSLGITGTQQISWTMPFSGDMFGRYYLSVSPQTPSFGCADVAGYGLTMEMFELNRVYLPLVVK